MKLSVSLSLFITFALLQYSYCQDYSPDNYTSIDLTDFQNDTEAQEALNFGAQFIFNQGIDVGILPNVSYTIKQVYNVSKQAVFGSLPVVPQPNVNSGIQEGNLDEPQEGDLPGELVDGAEPVEEEQPIDEVIPDNGLDNSTLSDSEELIDGAEPVEEEQPVDEALPDDGSIDNSTAITTGQVDAPGEIGGVGQDNSDGNLIDEDATDDGSSGEIFDAAGAVAEVQNEDNTLNNTIDYNVSATVYKFDVNLDFSDGTNFNVTYEVYYPQLNNSDNDTNSTDRIAPSITVLSDYYTFNEIYEGVFDGNQIEIAYANEDLQIAFHYNGDVQGLGLN